MFFNFNFLELFIKHHRPFCSFFCWLSSVAWCRWTMWEYTMLTARCSVHAYMLNAKRIAIRWTFSLSRPFHISHRVFHWYCWAVLCYSVIKHSGQLMNALHRFTVIKAMATHEYKWVHCVECSLSFYHAIVIFNFAESCFFFLLRYNMSKIVHELSKHC